jgi:ABC-type glycerol-3-phosphate transport system substrate-binding protein
MKKIAVVALAFAMAACGADNNETADTTTVPGVDTTAGLAVPVTDTVVKTTTTDTIQGEAKRDSVKDSTKARRP